MITKAQIDAAMKVVARNIDLEIAKALTTESFFATPQARGNNYTTELVTVRSSSDFRIMPLHYCYGCGAGNCVPFDQ